MLSKSDFTNVPIKVVFTFKNRRWGLKSMLDLFVLLVKVISVPLFFFIAWAEVPRFARDDTESMKITNKTALVTGAGRGIGRAIALKLAREGASVVVNDMDDDPAVETVDLIRAIRGEAVACVGSVTAPDFGERFVKTALDTFGGIDIIVNNAGYTWDSVIQKMTDEQFQAMMDVHVTRRSGFCARRPSRSADLRRRRPRRAGGLPESREHLLRVGLGGIRGRSTTRGKAASSGSRKRSPRNGAATRST